MLLDREGKARFHRMSHSTKNESKSRKSETDDLRIARNPDDESKLKKAKEQLGEELGGFDALEWDTGAPAYNPELINLKTDIVRIICLNHLSHRCNRKVYKNTFG